MIVRLRVARQAIHRVQDYSICFKEVYSLLQTFIATVCLKQVTELFEKKTIAVLDTKMEEKFAKLGERLGSPRQPASPPKVHNSAMSYVTVDQFHQYMTPIQMQMEEIRLAILKSPTLDDRSSKRICASATPVPNNCEDSPMLDHYETNLTSQPGTQTE